MRHGCRQLASFQLPAAVFIGLAPPSDCQIAAFSRLPPAYAAIDGAELRRCRQPPASRAGAAAADADSYSAFELLAIIFANIFTPLLSLAPLADYFRRDAVFWFCRQEPQPAEPPSQPPLLPDAISRQIRQPILYACR